MGSLRYTIHALKQMSFRKISERDVLAVWSNPTKLEAGDEECLNYFGIAPNGRPIRITLDPTETIVLTVVTVKRSRV